MLSGDTVWPGSQPYNNEPINVSALTESENNAPIVRDAIPDVTVNVGSDPRTINLSAYFFDSDQLALGDSLTYSIESNSDSSLVTPVAAGNLLTLAFSDSQNGSARLTVRATDSLGEFAELSMKVNLKIDGSVVSTRLESPEKSATAGAVRASLPPVATVNEWETANLEIWYTVGSDTPETPFDLSVLVNASGNMYSEPQLVDSLTTVATLSTSTHVDLRPIEGSRPFETWLRTVVSFEGIDLSGREAGEMILIGVLQYTPDADNEVGISIDSDGTYPTVQEGLGFELRSAEFVEDDPVATDPTVAGRLAVVTYDTNDDGVVDLQDFSNFVANFGASSDPELSGAFKSTAVNFDFNRNGRVDLADFSWFVEHFGRLKGRDAPIEMPGLTTPDSGTPGITIDPSVAIPVTNAVDHVYDSKHDILYILTSTGDLERWSYQKQTLLDRIPRVATSPRGLEISPDGAYAYVGDQFISNGEGTIWKVDLRNNAKTALKYTLAFHEQGVYDLALASNNQLFFTTGFAGSGWTPLRSLDLATNEMVELRDVRQNTGITRGEDRSLLLFQESNISSGPLFTYDATTDTFSDTRNTGSFNGVIPAAVSPDGQQVIFNNSILSPSLDTQQVGQGNLYGLTYGDAGEIFFGVDIDTDEVLVFDAASYSLLRRISIGADVTSSTDVSITDHFDYLFITTTTGIRQIATFPENGRIHDTQAPHGQIQNHAAFPPDGPLLGIEIEFDEPVKGVTVDDLALMHGNGSNLLTGNERVVSLNHGQTWLVILDPQLTADTGTYWITLDANGSGITDLSGNLLGNSIEQVWHRTAPSESGIRLPFRDAVDQVFDATSGILYFTTAEGSLKRWDTQSKTLLPSIDNIAVSPRGLDVTPDGQFAYIGEGVSGATGGIVWKIDLSDGTRTSITFDHDSDQERGVYDLAIAADGKLLFTTDFAGSGFNPLRAIDLDSGMITQLRTVNQSTSIVRAADYSRLFFQEANISSGPITSYDAITSTFSTTVNTGRFIGGLPDAVSHDGSFVAFLGSVLDASDLSLVATGLTDVGGYAFDPERDILYVANTMADAIVAYDAATLIEIDRFPVGLNLFGTVELSVTGSSGHAFISTTAGILEVPISIPDGDVVRPTAEIVEVVPSIRAGAVQTLTVQFSEAVTGVTLDDFILTQDGVEMPLDGSATLESPDGGKTWILGNLGDFNAGDGNYLIKLVSADSEILDLSGNPLLADATGTWQIDTTAFGSVLLPFADTADHVFDAENGILYILTSGGSIQRWEVATQTLLGSFDNIATTPSGFDITPDGQFAYVGEGFAGATGGTVWRIDLTDGTKTGFSYTREGSQERGVSDLVIGSDGNVYFTTTFAGSGWTPVRELDPQSGAMTKLRNVRQSTSIERGADRSRLFFQENNISSGPILVYDIATGSFIASEGTDRFIGSLPDAVSRDGSMVAFLGSVLDTSDLSTISIGIANAGAYAFDTQEDLLYVVDTVADQVLVYDPSNLNVMGRYTIGEDVSGSVELTVGAATGFVFVTTPSGVRQIALANIVSEQNAPTAQIIGLDPSGTTGPINSLTIRFSEAVTGVTLDDFSLSFNRGANRLDQTVSLLSSDGGKTWSLGNLARLTQDQGSYQLKLVAQDSDIRNMEGIQLKADVSAKWTSDSTSSVDTTLLFAGAKEHVFDPSRGLLYVLTQDGSLERWDVETQTLLASFDDVVDSPSSFDITPDGQYAYVGEGFAGVTGGAIRKVDLSDGSVTTLIFDADSPERGVYDLAISADGKAFFTTNFAGSGWTPLRELDLATEEFTRVRTVNQSTGISRGADHSVLFFQESNISSGPIFTYHSDTGTLANFQNTNVFVGSLPSAISHDGNLLAFRGTVYSTEDLSVIAAGLTQVSGLAFDPNRDILFVVDSSTDEIVAYDPAHLIEIDRFPIGEDVSGSLDFSVDSGVDYAYLTTESGIRQIAIAIPDGDVFRPVGSIQDVLPVVRYDAIDTMTVQFTEAVQGVSLDDFALRRNNGANLLTGGETLTSSDGGVTWNLSGLAGLTSAVGSYQFSLNATGSGISDLVGNTLITSVSDSWDVILPEDGGLLLPFADVVDHVYDPVNSILYFTLPDGSLQRWDVAAQKLLPAFTNIVEAAPRGLDISPDGQFALIGKEYDTHTNGAIWKVDLSDGSKTRYEFNLAFGEGPMFDLKIGNNGFAIFTTNYNGSGWTPLHELNLETGEVTDLERLRSKSAISRGADRSVLLVQEAFTGEIFLYDSQSRTLSSVDTNNRTDSQPSAISPDGSQFAFFDSVFEVGNLTNRTQTGITNVAAYVYDPSGDNLYVADMSTDEIVAYNAINFDVVARYAIGEDIDAIYDVSIDDLGTAIFLTTPSGIRQIPISGVRGTQTMQLLIESEPPILATAEQSMTATATPAARSSTIGSPSGDLYWGTSLSTTFKTPGRVDQKDQADEIRSVEATVAQQSDADRIGADLSWQLLADEDSVVESFANAEDRYEHSVDELFAESDELLLSE